MKGKALILGVLCLGLMGTQAKADVMGGDGPPSENSEYLFGFSGCCGNQLSTNLGNAFTATSPLISGTLNQGWFSNANGVNSGNNNYIVGDLSNNGTNLFNNFFTFDIRGLSGTVTSAVFNVRREVGLSDLGATSHTYSIFDVSTDAVTLNTTNGINNAIWTDLGSGTSYGSHSITVAGAQAEILNLALNANAVADLNTAIGNNDQYFSIGGTLFPVAVPEPATLLLLGAGLVGLGFYRRRN